MEMKGKVNVSYLGKKIKVFRSSEIVSIAEDNVCTRQAILLNKQ